MKKGKSEKNQGKTLDLHGMTTDEAISAVDQFLVEQSSRAQKTARIMTGKGSGKLHAIVVDYLKKAHYPWQFEKSPNGTPNQGVLVVFIN